MKITREELKALLELLGITEPEELNCEEFLSLIPGYLEKLRVQEAASIEGYGNFLHHLKICPECQEEFDALCEALRKGIVQASVFRRGGAGERRAAGAQR